MLVAKQLWCVFKNPHFFVAIILKEKYFKDENVLEAKVKRMSSFAWKSKLLLAIY